MGRISTFSPLFAVLVVTALAETGSVRPSLRPEDREFLLDLHADICRLVGANFYPSSQVTPEVLGSWDEVAAQLPAARSLNDGCLAIADAFRAFDPGIRLHMFQRAYEFDYSWSGRMYGDKCYVTQLDTDGAAIQMGLRLGDRIVAIENVGMNRDNYRVLMYALRTIAPQSELRLIVESPGEPPRAMTIPATIREARKVIRTISGARLALGKADQRHYDDYLDPEQQLRMVGDVAVWRAGHLARDERAVRKILSRAGKTRALIIDLRGLKVFRWRPMLEVIEEVMPGPVDVGHLEQSGGRQMLRSRCGGRYQGEIVVLTDAATGGFAEVLTHVLQAHKRARVVGDRTQGHVRLESIVSLRRFRIPSRITWQRVAMTDERGRVVGYTQQPLTIPAQEGEYAPLLHLPDVSLDPAGAYYGVRLTTGRIHLADGAVLHGQGVTPDESVRPTPEDIGDKRDVMLAHALAKLGVVHDPCESYKLFRNEWEDAELVLDQTHLW